MFPTISIGPLSLPAPGLILLAAVYLGLWVSEKYAQHFQIPAEELYNLTFYALIGGVLGGRLFFVFGHPQAFIQSPRSLISLNLNMINWQAGFLTALLVAGFYLKNKNLSAWHTLDAFTPALGVLAFGIGLSNLASGKAFGSPTDLPWHILLWNEYRHPTQIYAMLAAALVLGWMLTTIKCARPEGVLFLQFSALTAGWMLFISAFRGDSILWPGGIRQDAVLAWLALAIALFLLYRQETTHG